MYADLISTPKIMYDYLLSEINKDPRWIFTGFKDILGKV